MKKIVILVLILLTFFPATVSFAQDGTGGKTTPDGTGAKPTTSQTSNPPVQKLQNPLKVNSIQAVILLAVDIAIYIGVSFSILAIIFVGFKFIMAQGKPEEINKAKEWLLWIVIGLAVLISSKVIVDIVQNTLKKSGVVSENLWQP